MKFKINLPKIYTAWYLTAAYKHWIIYRMCM